ncbi:MAG TPA: DPP IV N-terminal domain-containing protein [bacterium]|nr:DPP IV N-terminal domain-containing protein [bacterium]
MRHPQRRLSGAALLARTGLCLLAALAFGVAALGAPAAAETEAQASVAPPDAANPAQDIVIEGLGFSKLILSLEVDPKLAASPDFRAIDPLLEKNLCWSGVFNLSGGGTRYCRINGTPSRVDMRLALTEEQGKGVLRLYDSGPERLQLYQDALPLDGTVDEDAIMAMVNRLTQRVTGQPGLLGSTLGFVLKQPGYAKVVVATTTQGTRLRLLSHDRNINILPRFNKEGTGMVYTVLGNRGSHVFYENLEPKDPKAIASFYLTPPGSLNSGGAFSPDGSKVIVTMSVNQNADLFLFDLKNHTHTQITSRLGIETQANWSPDGKQLLFVSDRSGSPQIYVMDLDTREDIRLTFDGLYNADPKWSPDGRFILFTKRVNGIDQIHIMDQYGENVRQVTYGNYTSEQAEWSPDGRQIVFASNRSGEYKLYVVSADGSNLRRLTSTPRQFEENSPTWTTRHLVR